MQQVADAKPSAGSHPGRQIDGLGFSEIAVL